MMILKIIEVYTVLKLTDSELILIIRKIPTMNTMTNSPKNIILELYSI